MRLRRETEQVIELPAKDADGAPWQMHWDPEFINELVSPLAGIWITSERDFTWSEAEPEFRPTHWRPRRGDA